MYENISALLILSIFTVKGGGQIRITYVFLEGTGGSGRQCRGCQCSPESPHAEMGTSRILSLAIMTCNPLHKDHNDMRQNYIWLVSVCGDPNSPGPSTGRTVGGRSAQLDYWTLGGRSAFIA